MSEKSKNIKHENYIVPVIILGLLGCYFIQICFKVKLLRSNILNQGIFIGIRIVENNAVVVASEVPGTIKEFYIKEGDTVTKGQAIAKIDDANLENNTLSHKPMLR